MSGRTFARAIGFAALLSAGLGVFRAHVAERRAHAKLEEVAALLSGSDFTAAARIAAEKDVIVARLDAHGATSFRTGPVVLRGQTLDATDAQLPPWPARAEVQAALAGARAFGHHSVPVPHGSLLIQTLAVPVAGKDVLYVLTGVFVFTLMRPPFLVLGTLIFGTFLYVISTFLARPRRPKVERL